MLGRKPLDNSSLMSVYTTLTTTEVETFLHTYSLPAMRTLTPIKGGIENSNYFVGLSDGRELVLTLFEELSAENAAFIGPLLAHLDAAGVPVAAALHDQQGRCLRTLANKPAQLAPRITGTHALHPDNAQCQAMGATLARLHLALRDYPLQRPNAHGAAWWSALAARWRGHLDSDDGLLLDHTIQLYNETCARHPDLPCGLIHGDLFRDNCLFDGNAVTAVLDFSETSHDHWLLDMAITINDFCRAWPNSAPDELRRAAFIDGYESVRLLQKNEKTALPVFLAVAAMRFWLSRLDIGLRNREEERSGEHVLEKDPAEMRDLMECLLREL